MYTNATGTNVYLTMAYNGYRLPTEAEWEKAARGGLMGNRFPWGNVITESHANFYAAPASYSYNLGAYSGFNTNFDNDVPYTSPVGSFAPNAYGLYDMAGNVFEWCWDWYSAPPNPGSAYLGGTNPTGVGPESGIRVIRGGVWSGLAVFACCANRYGYRPDSTDFNIGFRCVRGL
jgi:formylglycine-generating enzyme